MPLLSRIARPRPQRCCGPVFAHWGKSFPGSCMVDSRPGSTGDLAGALNGRRISMADSRAVSGYACRDHGCDVGTTGEHSAGAQLLFGSSCQFPREYLDGYASCPTHTGPHPSGDAHETTPCSYPALEFQPVFAPGLARRTQMSPIKLWNRARPFFTNDANKS
jgi:hypothetical protein